MANTLRFKRGLVSTIPTAALGEPLFTTDTFDLYIGNGTTNTRFQKYIASGTTSQLLRGDGSLLTMPIVLTSPANGQVLKYNGTSWVNDSDAGITGSGAAGQVAYFTGATTQSGSNNLFWDATNNRLGIGTNTPSFPLHVSGVGYITGNVNIGSSSQQKVTQFGGAATGLTIASATYPILSLWDTGDTNWNFMLGMNDGLAYIYNQANSAITFSTNATERMRLHAGGNLHLGGTSDNGLRFQVTGDGYFSGSVGIGTTSIGTNKLVVSGNTQIIGTGAFITLDGTGVTSLPSGLNYGLFPHSGVGLGISSSVAISFWTASSQKMLLDASGNLGLGVTPSAWDSYRGLQIDAQASLSSAGGVFNIGTNVFYGASGYTYIANGEATLYQQASGAHNWRTAPSGTAGNAISFTQAMTLTANGDLLLAGTNNPFSVTNRGNITLNGTASNIIAFTNNTSTKGYIFHTGTNLEILNATTSGVLSFYTETTERMRIFSDGNVAIGTTTNATYKLDVNGTMRVSGILSAKSQVYVDDFVYVLKNTASNYYIATNGVDCDLSIYLTASTDAVKFASIQSSVSGRALTLNRSNGGNVLIGTSTDAGFKLDVNGTMRVSGASTFGGDMTITGSGVKNFNITSTTANSVIKLNTPSTFSSYIQYNSNGSSALEFYDITNATTRLTIASTGAATFSSSVTIATNLVLNGTSIEQNNASGLTLNASNASGAIYFRTAGSEKASFTNSGNFIVDTNTFVVDATNNRVGVGTNVPTSSLHVVGSVTKSHTTKTANYTMTESDYTVLCDTTSGGFTISLPAASGCSGRIYVIKKITGNSGTNNITIDPNGAETIDGSATYTLQCRSSVMIQSNGSNWWILAEKVDTSCL